MGQRPEVWREDEVELTTQANGLPTEAVFADKASANDKLKHDESLAHLPNRWDLIRPEIATISRASADPWNCGAISRLKM
jgi:hypothetical protein